MALTLSHQSALDVLRTLRADGVNVQEMDAIKFAPPISWDGKNWGRRCFDVAVWRWSQPDPNRHLHVLVPQNSRRMRVKNVDAHAIQYELPFGSVLWLDERSSMVCPELLFLQMAARLALPMLVMLGFELCGHYARAADAPLEGGAVDGIPAATSAERIADYLATMGNMSGARGIAKAKTALRYIRDHAMSVPEAVLATMYSLPPAECGYGMGPVTLNERVEIDGTGKLDCAKTRYPDILFPFAPVGINYDGEGHLDLASIVAVTRQAVIAEGDSAIAAEALLASKVASVREKVVDDLVRTRQLAAQGTIVFPATKEDMATLDDLDSLTWQILGCAKRVFGVDTAKYERLLDDTAKKRDRGALLWSLTHSGGTYGSSYGKA